MTTAHTSRPRIYIHRAGHWYPLFMDEHNEAELSGFVDVVSERESDTPLPAEQLIERLRGCSAILSLNGHGSEDITPEIIAAAGTVRVICIAHTWGHFAHITNSTDLTCVEGSNAGTAAVAEWILTAALMGVRRLHVFDRVLKDGSSWGDPRRSVGMLAGSRVGLVGLGRIGRYSAHMFRALGARVVAYSRSCTSDLAHHLGVQLVSLEELMRTSDVISLNHRVVDATRAMLDAPELAMIKPGCVFINAARAALYNESALIAELQTGRFTAYIDVFESEPIPAGHPFRVMQNVVITPHIAGNNTAMFRRCASQAIATLEAHFAGSGLSDKRHCYP